MLYIEALKFALINIFDAYFYNSSESTLLLIF